MSPPSEQPPDSGPASPDPGNEISLDTMTLILNQARAGDDESAALAWELVMVDLQKIARSVTSGFQTSRRHQAHGAGGVPSGVASPTTVVHEAFLRIVDSSLPGSWDSRRHFFGTMTRAMSSYLLDRCRHDNAIKRGRDVRVVPLEFVQEEVADLDAGVDLAEQGLFEALDTLETVHPEAAEVVRLRFIAGLGQAETASITGLAVRTVSKRWNFARSFLRREMARQETGDPESPSPD